MRERRRSWLAAECVHERSAQMATDAAVRPAGAALCACHGCCAAWAPSGRVVGACSSRSEIVDFPTRTCRH